MIARVKRFAAAGRFLWRTRDRGFKERLYRVKAPTLPLWGESDRLITPIYSQAFRRALTGAAALKE